MKGKSGNPKGRPRRAIPREEVAKRLALGPDELFAFLEAMLHSKNERVAIDAAKLLLAYRLGTPTQRVEMTGANGGPMQFEDARDKLTARIVALAARTGTDRGDGVTH